MSGHVGNACMSPLSSQVKAESGWTVSLQLQMHCVTLFLAGAG